MALGNSAASLLATPDNQRHIIGPATEELKLDGYRAIAMKASGRVQLRSRNNKDFNRKYPAVAETLAVLPDDTVIDGEIVALDDSGRPSFNALQNYGSSNTPIFYYVFDVLVLSGRDVMSEPLTRRRDLLRSHILPGLKDPIRECPELNASLADVVMLYARRAWKEWLRKT